MPVEPKILLIIAIILLTLSSCLVVSVEKTEREADVEFQKARQRVLKLSLDSSTSSRPDRLKMLVYDPDDGQLLRIALPLWLVKKGLNHETGVAVRSHGPDFEFDDRRICAAACHEEPIVGSSKGVLPLGRRAWILCPAREGEAGSEANVGRGKAKRFPLQVDFNGFSRAVSKMPPGLLAEVLTDREKVLLWLE